MDASHLLMVDGRGLKADPQRPTASKCPGGKTLGLPRQTGRVQAEGYQNGRRRGHGEAGVLTALGRPGVGLLGATALVAMMGDPAAFRSGREFAAWLGLVPRHSGTGGRVRMLGISKRGDTYVRTLLIHGARTALTRVKAPTEWQLRLAKRRPLNIVTLALANKTARTAWAFLAHDREYDPNFAVGPYWVTAHPVRRVTVSIADGR